MSDEPAAAKKFSAVSADDPVVNGGEKAAETSGRDGAQTAPAPAVNQLSPEEQMERFAQELKENDWGHQPC